MRRAATVLMLLAASAAALGQQSSVGIDREKLAALRRMPPEERAKLVTRLEELKKLPVVERERLKDNLARIKTMQPEEVKKLREKARVLTEAERKEYGDLATGFFRWSQRNGTAQGFPRGQFFQWLRSERPERMDEIRQMKDEPGSPRIDSFVKLSYEFRDVLQGRTEQHVQKHLCVPIDEVRALKDAAFREFWPRWTELTRTCQLRRANPGPVAPRK